MARVAQPNLRQKEIPSDADLLRHSWLIPIIRLVPGGLIGRDPSPNPTTDQTIHTHCLSATTTQFGIPRPPSAMETQQSTSPADKGHSHYSTPTTRSTSPSYRYSTSHPAIPCEPKVDTHLLLRRDSKPRARRRAPGRRCPHLARLWSKRIKALWSYKPHNPAPRRCLVTDAESNRHPSG
jgi:hypothetical protein